MKEGGFPVRFHRGWGPSLDPQPLGCQLPQPHSRGDPAATAMKVARPLGGPAAPGETLGGRGLRGWERRRVPGQLLTQRRRGHRARGALQTRPPLPCQDWGDLCAWVHTAPDPDGLSRPSASPGSWRLLRGPDGQAASVSGAWSERSPQPGSASASMNAQPRTQLN